MKALVFHTPKHVSVDTVEDPKIQHPRDVILRVTATAICGSDLLCMVVTAAGKRSTSACRPPTMARAKSRNSSRTKPCLFLSDIVPTAYSGLRWADLQPGETVAVIGYGPVGLMALKLAKIMGAGRTIGVDMLPYRLDKARNTAGAETINAREVAPVGAIRALTHGRGAGVVIEAVGMEPERGLLKKIANVAYLQRESIRGSSSRSAPCGAAAA